MYNCTNGVQFTHVHVSLYTYSVYCFKNETESVRAEEISCLTFPKLISLLYIITTLYMSRRATMAERLRCSTLIHKILCSNLSIIMYGITSDMSPTAQLCRMTDSYHSNASSVSTLDGRVEDTDVCKRKKTIQTGCMWILIITASGPNRRYPSSKKLM